MSIIYPFEYRRLGDFAYHVLTDPVQIKAYIMKWIMREWESDHSQAPEEHWTVKWMNALPSMEFSLKVVDLANICPNADLMSMAAFQTSLDERADEREESILRGVSIEPLLVDRHDFELMDGYARYTVLKRYGQEKVYAYVGTAGVQSLETLDS
ncbi:MAG TPA: hypothetical protein VK900_04075 [Anaerolineales bacterium]|nr:hypothetical protein [Anaerolineales bacterium]